MKRNVLLLSSLLLLAPFASGCQGKPTVSSEESSFFVPTNLFLRLEIGEKKALDLTTLIQGSFTLETTSTNVFVSGTRLIGMDYGPFSVDVIHAQTRVTLEGEVLTKNAKEMEDYLSSLGETYIAYDSFSGPTLASEDYYATLIAVDSSSGAYIYSGGVRDPESSLYIPFYIGSTPLSELGEEMVYSEASFYAGYERSKESLEMKGWTLPYSSFSEVKDENGESLGDFRYFASSSEIYSVYVSLLGSSNPMGNFILNYSDVAGIQLHLNASYLRILPIDKKGNVISSLSISGYSIPTEVDLWGSDFFYLPSIENWLGKPSLPPQFGRDELPQYFSALKEADSFSYQIEACWMNPDTGSKTVSPSNLIFSDTGTTMFSSFSTNGVYASGALEKTVMEVASNATSLAGNLPSSGDRTLIALTKGIVGNNLQTFHGSNGEGGFTYEKKSTVVSRQTNLFDAGYLPNSLTQDSTWKEVSIHSKTTDETGDIVFGYDPNGKDFSEIPYNVFYGGVPYALSCLDYGDLGTSGFLYLYYLGFAWTDSAFEITLHPASQEFTFTCTFEYSSELVYRYRLEIGGVGTSSLSEEAKSILGV
ncbi:MAG: hypothetical protein SPG64_01595 [Candidatus Enteromonas sp.]|nr:hypothetical protein [Candidatus Enteromonas sp.]